MKSIHKQIDAKLQLLAQSIHELAGLQAAYEAELEAVRTRHEPRIQNVRTLIDTIEKELKAILRKNKDDVFEGSDLVELPSGRVLRHVAQVVHRARGLLNRLKELGRRDAIKITENVNWQVLEKWSDEELEKIGTYRKIKEDFGYELKARGTRREEKPLASSL